MSVHAIQPMAATNSDGDATKAKWLAAGGILGAVAASTCCILPLALFGLGITGAWIGLLTALSPYQPIFIAFALGCLGWGYWFVYRTSKTVCAEGEACARPVSGRIVKGVLWLATFKIGLVLSWPFIVPFILG